MSEKVSAKRLARAALFVALGIIFGKYLAVTVGPVRVSLENLPVLMAGVMLGPLWGGAVGVVADLLGSVMVGYTINPVIAVGAASIGVVSGAVYQAGKPFKNRLLLAVVLAHAVGSVGIKTAGLVLYYGYPWAILIYRVPLYATISAVEYLIIKRFAA